MPIGNARLRLLWTNISEIRTRSGGRETGGKWRNQNQKADKKECRVCHWWSYCGSHDAVVEVTRSLLFRISERSFDFSIDVELRARFYPEGIICQTEFEWSPLIASADKKRRPNKDWICTIPFSTKKGKILELHSSCRRVIESSEACRSVFWVAGLDSVRTRIPKNFLHGTSNF